MRTQHKWTDEHYALLKELFPNGSHAWIAEQLNAKIGSNLSRNAVIGKCHRIGLVKNTEEDKARRQQGDTNKAKARTIRQQITGYQTMPRQRIPIAARLMVKNFDQYAAENHLDIAFFDLAADHCRFPKGDGLAATYCGQPIKPDSSYCPFHHALCHEPLKDRQARRAA